ncbi:Crp/Fnr family transcriptional regulator [Catalinimonas niigatensis]|uniref:Crp/Fnr family transcriptional regulator n=1 Tax=Catalinimonas niigatensis TaxID=1397264 RepID=UPI002666C98F|nr:Crp/Fnr family transcriptional regulator [Catalinimonas niigatensis]WPP49286.1 Crp/Fnr family transcriptional regulator [Catalinimonas niigatensis]
MIFDNFWTFTAQFVSFSSQEKEQIKRQFTIRDVPKHHVLIDIGQVADEIYFINKGCMRFYYLTEEGEEVTGFIFLENMMAGSSESFFSRIPSSQVVETLEESELLVVTHNSLEQLYSSVPKMNILVRKILEQRMAFAQKVVASLIIHKPQDRYSSYQQLHPDLENRIPQHILASYMGITPVSLSRIRKRLSKGE